MRDLTDMSQKNRGEEKKRGEGTAIAVLLAMCMGPAFPNEPTASQEKTQFERNGEAPTEVDLSRSTKATLAVLDAPLKNFVKSSPFGWRENIEGLVNDRPRFHYGVDYVAPLDAPIYAAQNGTIKNMGKRKSMGNYVRVLHDNGVETTYCHLARFVDGLHIGKKIRDGDVLGFIGLTGRTTGPHLHYEVHVDGIPIDPDGNYRDSL